MSYSYLKNVFPKYIQSDNYNTLFNNINVINKTTDQYHTNDSLHEVLENNPKNDYRYKDNYTIDSTLTNIKNTLNTKNTLLTTFDKNDKESYKDIEFSNYTTNTPIPTKIPINTPIEKNNLKYYQEAINPDNFTIENYNNSVNNQTDTEKHNICSQCNHKYQEYNQNEEYWEFLSYIIFTIFITIIIDKLVSK